MTCSRPAVYYRIPRSLTPAYVYRGLEGRGVLAVVASRRNTGTGPGPIGQASQRFKRLYRARASVEREFARLKTHLGLGRLTVRGLEQVGLHADLCLIARLALVAEGS